MKNYFKLIPPVYLVLRKGDIVLLLRRANTGYQDGKYSLIAGHLDGNEHATDAMVREAKEEAGITVDPSKLKFAHLAHRLNRNQESQERIDIFFELKEWSGEIINKEPEKCDDISWHSFNKLPDNIVPFIKLVLIAIDNKVPYSEYELEPY